MYVQPYMKVPGFPNIADLLDVWQTQWAHLASLRGPAVVLGAALPGSWRSRSVFGAPPKSSSRPVQTGAVVKHMPLAAASDVRWLMSWAGWLDMPA